VIAARVEANPSTFVPKVEKLTALWLEKSARAGTPVTYHDHVEPMHSLHNGLNKDCVIVCAQPLERRPSDGRVYRVTPP
jgi:hypothetical protein